MHGLHVDADRALDAPPAGSLHAAPVLERGGNQRVGGNVGDRVVPVAHLHRRQRNVENLPVHAHALDFYPVLVADEIVRRNHHARREAQQRVLEDDQKNRHQRAEPRQKIRGRFVRKNRKHPNRRAERDQDFQRLEKALDRNVLEPFVVHPDDHQRAERGEDRSRDRDGEVDARRRPENLEQPRPLFENRAEKPHAQHGGEQMRRARREMRLAERVVPRVAGTLRPNARDGGQRPFQRALDDENRQRERRRGKQQRRVPGVLRRQSRGTAELCQSLDVSLHRERKEKKRKNGGGNALRNALRTRLS